MFKSLKLFYLALIALLGLCGAVAVGNYTLTQGVGTTFGSIIVAGTQYAQQFFCDPTSPSQCAAISAGGAVKVDNSAVTQPISAVSLPLPAGAATNATLVTINTTLGTPLQAGGTVIANAGTNLNTSALALETGGNLANISTAFGSPGATACATDTASCNQNQQMQRLAQRLTSIVTALGSPFQAGGSIGNTTFASTQSGTWTVQPGNTANTVPWLVSASQAGTWNVTNISGTVSLPTGAATSAKQPAFGTAGTAATDVLTVQGIASMTPLLATLSGTNNLNNISGTITLPTGAATATNQTNASQKTQIVDGSGNVIASTSNNLNVQCANCSGSGASAADEATFTAGTSVLAPGGGFFQTTATNNALTNGQQGMWQLTANRAGFVNLRNASGTEVGTNGSPLRIDPVGTTTQPISGTITVTQSTASNLNVTCANCSGSGASGVDEAAFTAGTSIFAPAGGFFQTTATNNALTTGQWGSWQMTANRAGFVNMRNAAGTEIGTSATPVQVSLANTGSNATAMLVTGTGGTFPATQSGTWTVNPTTAANWGIGTSTQNSATIANGILNLGQFNTTPTTITSGNMSPLQMDSAGNLLVNIKAGAGSGGTALADNAAFTQGTTSITPIGCFFTSGTYSAITTLHAGVLSCTSAGSLHTTVDNSNSNGSATSANSSPVVIASDQAAIAVKGNAASGSAVSGNPILVAGQDGTNARTLLTDTSGRSVVVGAGTAGTATGGVLTVQGVASMTKLLVTPDSVALPANQSVNISQINSVTPLMGNGITGTGSQRVTIASDNTAFSVNATLQASATTAIGKVDPNTAANWALGATGSAAPANAHYTGVNSSGNLTGLIQADASAAISVSTATTTQIVALSSTKKIYVTSLDIVAGGTGNITFVYGTGTACATGTTSLTGAYNLTAQSGIAKGSGLGPVLVVPASNALCITTSAAVQMSGSVAYTQF